MKSDQKTIDSKPPKWLDRLLEWFCDPDLVEDLQGDLYELYHAKRESHSVSYANWHYAFWVLRSLRWSAISKQQKLKTLYIMKPIQNIKVSWRVLKREKFNTFLNLLGMTIGISCLLLLGLYYLQETSFDKFHERQDRIYRAWLYEDYGEDQIFFNSTTPFLFEDIFEKDFPEVETAVQFTLRSYLIGKEERLFNESVGIISPEFFEVFDFNLVGGQIKQPLSQKESVVISQDFSNKYFGELNPIGQSLGIQINENFKQFTISAVMEDMPINSSIQFDIAISNENNPEIFGERALTGWFNVTPETYILLKPNSAIADVNAKSQDVVMSYLSEEMNRDEYNIGFQPLTDIHLNPEIPVGNSTVVNPKYVGVLGFIGVLVMFIAAINYTTLSVGQSLKRSVEVGMRKVMGASRGGLISQYLTESVLITAIATFIGSVLAIAMIPTFNQLTGSSLNYVFEWWHVLVCLAMIFMIGILSGIYPVWSLSSGRSMYLIQGHQKQQTNHWVRKGLMVFQFVITVFLITSALTMKRQLDFIANKPLGYQASGTVYLPMFPGQEARNLPERVLSARDNGWLYRDQLDQIPEVKGVTQSTHVFGSNGWANLAFTDDKDIFRRFRLLGVDPGFIEMFNIKVTKGRSFEEGNGLDSRQSILVNEAAVAYFGWDEPIGKSLPGENFGPHQIIGVVKDFHYASLHHKVEPLIITQNLIPIFQGISDGDIMDSMIPKIIVNYQTDDFERLRAELEEKWKATFPGMPFEFYFLEDRLANQYEAEIQMKQLVNVAMIVSLVIAAIGLLGLTVLITNSRQKEFGIRKVLGAQMSQLFVLMVRSFSWQLLIGIGLSIPFTIYLMRDWLQNFAYRIDIGIDLFLISGLFTLMISIIVISYHTFKAARNNPVNALRSE